MILNTSLKALSSVLVPSSMPWTLPPGNSHLPLKSSFLLLLAIKHLPSFIIRAHTTSSIFLLGTTLVTSNGIPFFLTTCFKNKLIAVDIDKPKSVNTEVASFFNSVSTWILIALVLFSI